MPQVDYPQPVRALIAGLKRLPGVGPRSAERIAVWLLGPGGEHAAPIASAMVAASTEVVACSQCGFFAETATGVCAVCSDPARDGSTLCVVESPNDVLPIERTGVFGGRYHVLGGKLSPLDNIGPEDLRIDGLIERCRGGEVAEVILGVGSDVEGEATASYLAKQLGTAFPELQITRLAQGLPAGGGLENADSLTLHRALEGRRNLGGGA